MSDQRLRRHIAIEAAKLMYERVEKEYYTAKRKAAAQLGVNFRHQPQHLPSNREIRDELEIIARMHEGEKRYDKLAEMRLAALRMMRLLEPFHPRLIGSVVTGHIRKGSDIDLHVFSHNASAITDVLDQHGYRYEVERKRVIKHNTERLFTHIHVPDRWTCELTVYSPELINYVFKSSITGKAIERASIEELEALIAREHPDVDLRSTDEEETIDPFMVWELLLKPLADVRQDSRWHPESDALYHSLQAFQIARDEYPYDEEMITAALLHDVGKAIDPHDHVAAGLEALEGTFTQREEFLIAHHMDAQKYHDGRLGQKLRTKLRASEWFDDLMTLRDIDDRARKPGMKVCTLEEALSFLREMREESWLR
jgi:predicted nucleotidyltransferase